MVNGYILWVRKGQGLRVIIIRDMIFNENSMPRKSSNVLEYGDSKRMGSSELELLSEVESDKTDGSNPGSQVEDPVEEI